jgi:hypothetical protein
MVQHSLRRIQMEDKENILQRLDDMEKQIKVLSETVKELLDFIIGD